MTEFQEYMDFKFEHLETFNKMEMVKIKEFYISKLAKNEEKHRKEMKYLENKLMSKIAAKERSHRKTTNKLLSEIGLIKEEVKMYRQLLKSQCKAKNIKAELKDAKNSERSNADYVFLKVPRKEANVINESKSSKDIRTQWKETFHQISPGSHRKRQQETPTRVAFFASITNYTEHLGANQDIVFDNAVTNIGNSYNPYHGIFTAPVDGVYVFHVTLERNGGQTWAHVMVNRQTFAKLTFEYNLLQSSQIVIVDLTKGDDVSIQNTYTDRSYSGDRYSTFSGFLLYENVNVIPVVGK